MQAFFTGILRSFSVQLLLLHLRSNALLLLLWVLLALMMSGILGSRLGIQYLFLDPEYLEADGFWPFLIIGLAFGFFGFRFFCDELEPEYLFAHWWLF